MKLSEEIIKHLLPEDDVNTVAIYAGGFKPPTSGHFQVLKQALEEHPDIDELLIYIGKKERDGITQAQSLLIWDVYKNYLPIKVSIVPSSVPPIKAVYNYAKDHPDTKVLWIIGAREGDEDDFSDIANRTKSVDKYDNLALAVTVTQGNVSGTAARNAANISIEKLIPFLPKELNDEERVEVFNIINNNLSEGRKKKKDPKKGTGKKPKGSGRRLYTDEDPKDTVGIKFSTRQDIVDTLNKKSFKAKSHARQSQIINLIHQRVRAALNRTKDPAKKKKLRSGFEYIKKRKEASKKKTQRLKKLKEGDTYEKMAAKGKKAGSLKQGTVRKRLKIPKGKKIPLSLINKEISRMKKMDKDDKKKGVQLGDKNQKYYKALQLAKTLKTTTNLNEVLDPKTFNFKPIMASLTKSMEADGLNLKPYPTVRFIHDEEANADNFFGMTAYYDPNNKEVVLYTLGRHPKDIMRSYAHELIHVHQDNEDRLHDIKTDDVNADKHLENLEREAYETGNIMFRSWTNKVTEGKKKGKDPFGLNAYAYELARLREDENENWYIYLDMDGVVADFDKRFEDLSGMIPQSYVNKYGLDKFWDLIDEKHKVAFWRGIELMPGANKLVNFVSQYPYEMLTAPSVKKQSIIGKSLWVKDKVGTLYPSQPKVTYRPAKLKHTVKPNLTKYDILIDDKKSTIDRWNNAGGTAIFYINANQVIDELKNLGL
jgi:hypothetical protein